MEDYCIAVLNELDKNLKSIIVDVEDDIQLADKSMAIIVASINKIKEYVINNDFKCQHEEIYFFKELKPKFLSKFLFFSNIYKIEINKPHGDTDIVIEYYKKEQSKIKSYFDTNIDFYKYHRSRSNLLDHKYFVRGEQDFKLNLDCYYMESDRRFTTLLDSKVANIISNDLILEYLKGKILKLENSEITHMVPNNIEKTKLTWTANKSDLVELIYALHTQSVFDNGKIDIKEIAFYFENVFNIQLGDFYRTFSEIKMRKGSRTKFMDISRDDLNKRIDLQDEK